VPIGVSIGNEGEWSSGTLGCRVKDGSAVYILSNNHVLANSNEAEPGDAILQPGQLLLLRVTPPATVTPIPVTPSATSTSTLTPVPPTSTQVLATKPPSPSAAVEAETQAPLPGMGVLVVVVLVVGGVVLLGWAWRRR
jgi:hypothetical protein